MKKWMQLALVAGSFVVYGVTQDAGETAPPGAKAVFGDKTRFAPKANPDSARNSPPPYKPGKPANGLHQSVSGPAIGLRYWIELIMLGSQEIQRVTSTHAFHSGDRIRLHFESNIDGHIVLIQMTPAGTSDVLFPSRRVRNGDNLIKTGTEMILPAEDAWFTFDHRPGTEQIIVLLTPEPVVTLKARHSTDSVAPSAQPARPPEPRIEGDQDSERSAVAKALTSSVGQKLAVNETRTLLGHVTKSLGSKSLLLETDDTSSQPAAYAVQVIDHDQNKSSDVLAIEIQLKHL